MRRMITELDLDKKQDKLTAGEGIKIENGTISTVAGNLDVFDILPLVEGSNSIVVDLNQTDDKIRFEIDKDYEDKMATKEWSNTQLAKKQDKLSQVDLDNIADINQIKLDVSSLDSRVSTKAETEYVDTQLSTKADMDYVTEQLWLKQDNLSAEQLENIAAVPNKADISYVDNAVSGVIQFNILVVEELPQTGVEHTIYLLKKTSSEGIDTHDEYLYIEGKWEFIGTTKVDLSEYETAAQTDVKLSKKQDNLSEDQLANIAAVPSKSDTSYVNEQLALKIDTSDRPTIISEARSGLQPAGDYATNSSLNTGLDAKQDKLSEEQIYNINDVQNKTTMAAVVAKGYQTADNVVAMGYQTKEDVNNIIDTKGFITVSQTDEKLTTKQDNLSEKQLSNIADAVTFTERWVFTLENGTTITKNVGIK